MARLKKELPRLRRRRMGGIDHVSAADEFEQRWNRQGRPGQHFASGVFVQKEALFGCVPEVRKESAGYAAKQRMNTGRWEELRQTSASFGWPALLDRPHEDLPLVSAHRQQIELPRCYPRGMQTTGQRREGEEPTRLVGVAEGPDTLDVARAKPRKAGVRWRGSHAARAKSPSKRSGRSCPHLPKAASTRDP
jgi:hypothetical protein